MKPLVITGMLAWYDEPPELLSQCVESCRVILDHLICLDGGYRLLDGAKPRSPDDQYEAIFDAGKRANLRVTIRYPDEVWAGQVEKRNYLIRQAQDVSSFVMPIDADWRLRGDRDAIRDELRWIRDKTQVDAVGVPFHTPVPEDVDLARRAAHPWHAELAGKTTMLELIFRALPGLRVESRHWWYSGIRDGERVALWGCQGVYPPVRTRRLEADFTIDHMCFYRDQLRIDRNRAYSARRDLQAATHGAEA